jgi:hypothetical protein
VRTITLPCYGKISLRIGVYGSGNLYVSFGEDPYSQKTISVFIRGAMEQLKKNEFFFDRPKLRKYEEDILASGYFEHTGKVEVASYYTYPIWRFLDVEELFTE